MPTDSTLLTAYPKQSHAPPYISSLLSHPCSFFFPSHLEQRPFCLPQLDEDPDGDAEHGGQCHEPAYAIPPGGVGVDVVILEGLVLDQKKDEDALQRDGERSLGPVCRRPGVERIYPPQNLGPHWDSFTL